MSDFVSKIVNLCITFTMVLAVIAMVFASEMMTSQRLILNESSVFLNKVADKSYINIADLNELYMSVNSHGMLVDVEVERLIYEPINRDGEVISNYVKAESTEELGVQIGGTTINEIRFNKNDLVRVRIKEVGMTTARKFIYDMIGIDTGSFELSMSAPVL